MFMSLIAIDWQDLEVSKRLQDGDVVTVKYTDVSPDSSQFALELAPHKTWWKGLELLDSSDGRMGFIEVQDQKKTAGPLTALSSDIEVGGHLILWKAGPLGVHFPVYVLADLEHVKGKKVTFRWVAD